MNHNITALKPYPLGAYSESGKLRFAFSTTKQDCGVVLFDKKTGEELNRFPFTKEEKVGNIYCKYIDGYHPSRITYMFYEGDLLIPDSRARYFERKATYMEEVDEQELKAGILKKSYDWENVQPPRLKFGESIFYCMHVRGFTKHSSSKVRRKGTFAGIIEKIPYLKETGITTLELQPAYEFMEVDTKRERKNKLVYNAYDEEALRVTKKNLSYWGYKTGYYYAPKAAYSASADAMREFKDMVKELHKNKMEVIMQFYFPEEFSRREILDVLHYWVLEYHVDGFHLMGLNMPISMIASDELLADTKILYYGFNLQEIYGEKQMKNLYMSEKEQDIFSCHLAVYQDDYMNEMRRFLKGDEDMISSVLHQMRHIPLGQGRIGYFTNYHGFTMMDMVSFERKCNEENGENNQDGTNYNHSWNCGEEGVTRKKKILDLRMKQIRNAMTLLVFSQTTPLIFMGDEFGNSQNGNNNPYCQDNETTWLDWRLLNKNKELYQFWCKLTRLRREHPVLRQDRELRVMDYKACGYPDISYHGKNAWCPVQESFSRSVGIMYCGKYVTCLDGAEDDFFYVGINMHWEPNELALPKLPKGMKWEVLLNTNDYSATEEKASTELTVIKENEVIIAPRSITVLLAKNKEEKASAKSLKRGVKLKNNNDRTIF